MKSLTTRVISAAFAVLVVGFLTFFLQQNGLKLLVIFCVVVCGNELANLLFQTEEPSQTKIFFQICNLSILTLGGYLKADLALSFVCICIFFIAVSLWLPNKKAQLSQLLNFQMSSLLGFFYGGLLPTFAYKLLDQENGTLWFLALLFIVLLGDTFAYFFGVFFGRKKILPEISPTKTIVGSLGGLVGSVFAAEMSSFFLPQHISWLLLLLLGLICSFAEQSGDFFESLLKRIANVKDSGHIMPGHGGILDRIDGILFALPFVYFFSYYF